jgi:hypothetical protein
VLVVPASLVVHMLVVPASLDLLSILLKYFFFNLHTFRLDQMH